jgi:hypothetical protein
VRSSQRENVGDYQVPKETRTNIPTERKRLKRRLETRDHHTAAALQRCESDGLERFAQRT